MADIRAAIATAVAADAPMTVRQVFYRLVSMGAIDKTEAEYKHTVCRLLTEMRLAGTIPFGAIADTTRRMRKPQTHGGLSTMLRLTAETYRRALWADQGAYVEVWLEKDALSGVLYEVTSEWDVPLMVTRGYPSLTYLHEAAMVMGRAGKPVYLYYLGDHDPSGLDIPRATEARLREFAPRADITFERVAVTPDQIAGWRLPTRPTKRTDSRANGFVGASVEVDAIPPDTLRRLIRSRIEGHVDADALMRARRVEREERWTLMRMAAREGDMEAHMRVLASELGEDPPDAAGPPGDA